MSILALDLGGTKLAGRLEVAGRTIVQTMVLPNGGAAVEELETILAFIAALSAEGREAVEAVALASAPTIGADGRVLRWPNRPHWQGVDLGAALRDTLGCNPVIEDDGNAAALAEARAMGVADLVYLGIGTGVGGGLVLGGRLHRGRGAAAEFGHMPVADAGIRCSCGRGGCLQAVASGPAIQVRAGITGQDPTAALRHALNDLCPEAWAAIGQAADALTVAILTLTEAVDPAVVAIGGGVADGIPELIGRVADSVHASCRQGQNPPLIRPALHGAGASLEGALLLARQTFATLRERNPVP